MFKVSLLNNGVETIIHYPGLERDEPHLSSIPLEENTSAVSTINFSIYTDNPGYNKIEEIKTYVDVTDLRTDKVRFSGRVYKCEEKMDTDGKIYKSVECENCLSYLNDTKERCSSYTATGGKAYLTQVLNNHNSKVDANRRLYAGNSDVTTQITHTCEFKSTLAELIEAAEDNESIIMVRKENGKNYVDWYSKYFNNTIEVSLGVNMKDMIISKDLTSFGTRIIPLGANNLTIESVNNGKDYIDEPNSQKIYGVIEKTVDYRDIEDASELKNKCLSDMNEHTQIDYVLETTALDLSYLTGYDIEEFGLNKRLHIVNQFMNVDDNYAITNISMDLLKPYSPKLKISKKKIKLTNSINDLRQSSMQNNGVYNNVQIGSAFGIRVVRSDNKAVTTMNATDGITIQNDKEKVFYVDTKGRLICINIQAVGGDFEGITVEEGTFRDIIVENGITISDDDVSCLIDKNGIVLTGSNGKKANIEMLDEEEGHSGCYISDNLFVKNVLRSFGRCAIEGNLNVAGSTHLSGGCRIDGKITIGENNGSTLREYIEEIVQPMIDDAINDLNI